MARIVVNQGQQTASSIVVKKGGDLTVQSLKNVVSTDLQDGYTLIYDSETQKFITSPVSVTAVNIDGGTF